MARDPIAAVERYHAALNALDLASIETMFAADAEYHSPSVGAVIGRAAILAAMRGYFAEYPDQAAIDDVLTPVGSDAVRSQWHLTATAKSTGAPYIRQGVETVYFTPDGLIRRVEVADL